MTTGNGRTIGPYRLQRVLHDGAVGTVYLADQLEPVRRPVALKVLKVDASSDEAMARFELEVKALSLMDHTAIAKVFDAGRTPEGQPYFTMEYVAGETLTAYCDKERLDLRSRLALFTEICAAVQHIHQKGVIHRDLKSSNILVVGQDGGHVPKLIDFGIARLTEPVPLGSEGLTSHGQVIGTPQYMSPEQATVVGDPVDTRTDIYSLGVVFYELVVGVLPFPKIASKNDYVDFFRRLRDVDPPTPSTRLQRATAEHARIAATRRASIAALHRQIRGDLDWIATKAMEKHPDRRYASASELGRDVARFLNDEPIVARPPSSRYRVGKLVRRHRTLVATMAAALLAALVGSALSGWWYVRAEAARRASDALIRLCEDVKDKTANAHLWLEEALAKDASIDLEENVYEPLRAARAHVRAGMLGEPTPFGQTGRLTDGTIDSLRRLAGLLDDFARITRARWERRNAGGETGSPLDQEYDALYERIRKQARAIAQEADGAAANRWRLSALTSITVNLVVLAVFGVIAFLTLRPKAR